MSKKIRVLAIDAGGTMTDTFIVNDEGEYIVGKAQTTPDDESVGFINSSRDALYYWGMSVEEAFPQIISSVYSGTTMINRLLERKGKKIGLIVTAGQEDYLRLERGRQTWLGYAYSDRLHVATHRHNEPLVHFERIRGVRGRIDAYGEEVFAIPTDGFLCFMRTFHPRLLLLSGKGPPTLNTSRWWASGAKLRRDSIESPMPWSFPWAMTTYLPCCFSNWSRVGAPESQNPTLRINAYSFRNPPQMRHLQTRQSVNRSKGL